MWCCRLASAPAGDFNIYVDTPLRRAYHDSDGAEESGGAEGSDDDSDEADEEEDDWPGRRWVLDEVNNAQRVINSVRA